MADNPVPPTPGPAVAGSLLGTNQLQSTVDQFDRAVQRLSTVVGNAGSGNKGTTLQSAFSAGRSGNIGPIVSNWMQGRSNGNGAPQQPSVSWPVTPSTSAPTVAPRPATSPNPLASVPNGGGGGPATPGISGAGAAAAAAGGAAVTGLGWAGRGGADESTNFVNNFLGSTATRMYTYGDRKAIGGGKMVGLNAAQDTNDYWAANMAVRSMGYLGNSSAFNQQMGNAAQMSILNPTQNLAQSAAVAGQFGSMRSNNMLRAYGISTYKNGKPASVGDITNQFMKSMDLKGRKGMDAEEVAALTGQSSMIQANLANAVQSGSMSQEQADAVMERAKAEMTARSKGISSEKLDSLLSDASSKKNKNYGDARKELKSLGIANTTLQNQKDYNANATESSNEQLQTFATTLETTNKLMGGFNAMLRQIPFLEEITGVNSGSKGIVGKIINKTGVGGALMKALGGSTDEGAANGAVGAPSTASSIAGSTMASLLGVSATGASAAGGGVGGTASAPGPGSSVGASVNPHPINVKPWVARAISEIQGRFNVPQVLTAGGSNHSSDHPRGLAADFVPTGRAQGDQVAAYVVANQRRLGVTVVIWSGRIYSNGSWRPYRQPDGARGDSADHNDHVHVSFTASAPGHGGGKGNAGHGGSSAKHTDHRKALGGTLQRGSSGKADLLSSTGFAPSGKTDTTKSDQTSRLTIPEITTGDSSGKSQTSTVTKTRAQGGGVQITFQTGAVTLSMGPGATTEDASAMGTAFANSFAKNERIRNLQAGVLN